MTELQDVQAFIAPYQNDTELWQKITSLINHIVTDTATDMSVVKYKYTDPTKIGNAAIEQVIIETGYSYIASVMETVSNFDFSAMVSFANLISNLKGTRVGMELVLQLMGFDSVITEWWEATPTAEPWSYKITVVVDTSHVLNLYTTLAALKVFSQNYVFAKISDIELQFSGADFATKAPTMGGFDHDFRYGSIVQRAGP